MYNALVPNRVTSLGININICQIEEKEDRPVSYHVHAVLVQIIAYL